MSLSKKTKSICKGSNKIEDIKQYDYWDRMLNMCWDMDVEISWKIRSGKKVFTTIKEVLKAKLDITLRANLFKRIVITAML